MIVNSPRLLAFADKPMTAGEGHELAGVELCGDLHQNGCWKIVAETRPAISPQLAGRIRIASESGITWFDEGIPFLFGGDNAKSKLAHVVRRLRDGRSGL